VGDRVILKPAILLLVEDDFLIQDLLHEELTDAGFETILARDGTTALSELEAGAARFKAVITDIDLGSGADGWDIGRRARELVSNMPVVYISGDSGHEWSSKGVPDSVIIAKPFAPAQLVIAISMLITGAGSRQSD
jgi:DNA-binding response OmpR family regulator